VAINFDNAYHYLFTRTAVVQHRHRHWLVCNWMKRAAWWRAGFRQFCTGQSGGYRSKSNWSPVAKLGYFQPAGKYVCQCNSLELRSSWKLCWLKVCALRLCDVLSDYYGSSSTRQGGHITHCGSSVCPYRRLPHMACCSKTSPQN